MCTDFICSIFFTNTWCCQSFSLYPYCRSLITNNAEHFPCMLWPLVCLLIWSVCLHFLTILWSFSFSWLICETSLQTPNISLLSDIGIGIIFPNLWLAFLFLIICFEGQRFLGWWTSISHSFFYYIDSASLCLKKSGLHPRSQRYFPKIFLLFFFFFFTLFTYIFYLKFISV